MDAIYCDINDSQGSIRLQPEKEGYLEKKGLGILQRTKHASRYCYVQGSMFYQQKSTHGAGAVDVLYMSDVQMVKPISSDTTGSQFEIIIKKSKSQIFICPNRDECLAWIRALKNAMVTASHSLQHDKGIPKSSFYTSSTPDADADIYTTISDTTPNVTNGQASATLTGGRVEATSPRVNSSVECNVQSVYSQPRDTVNNVYDIPETKRAERKPQPAPCLTPPHIHTDTHPIPKNDLVYNEGCSMGQSVSKETATTGNSVYAEGCSTSEATQNGLCGSEEVEHRVQVQPTMPQPTIEVHDVDETDLAVADETENEDELETLFRALNRPVSPVPDLEYLVTKDDRKRVMDLKDLLRITNLTLHMPTNRLPQTDDPITSCRAYLATLDGSV